MKNLRTATNCFSSSYEAKYLNTYPWEVSPYVLKNNLKLIGMEEQSMLFNLLNVLMNLNEQNKCSYELF